MGQTVKRRLGFPFRGYVASVPRHMAPAGAITGDSHDWLIEPTIAQQDGRLVDKSSLIGRRGMSVVGGTAGLTEAGGLFAAARSRQLLELSLPSLADGYPTHAVVYTQEDTQIGQLYFRSTNSGGSNRVMGDSFGAFHYPANFKMVPLASGSLTDHTRCANAEQRGKVLSGTRRALVVGEHFYAGAFTGTPLRWNQRFNDSTIAGTENERIFPAGHIPPLGMPIINTGTVATDGAWATNDQFYISVVFKWRDGSFSQPTIPRPKNDQLANGYGLVTVGGVSQRFSHILWSEVPIGPDGVIARYLCRTPKIVGSASTPLPPDVADLRLTAIIDNNTETTYNDPNGNDVALRVDALAVRFDGIWMPRSRYLWAFDQRIAGGYARVNRGAIVLAPYPAGVGNNDETIGSDIYTVEVTSAEPPVLKLRKNALLTTITTSGKTLGRVVDEVNATVDSGTNGGTWRAQMVPGADANGSAHGLTFTFTNGGFGDAQTGPPAVSQTEIRAYSNAYPAVLYRDDDSLFPSEENKRAFWFTAGGAGSAPNAANNTVAGNFRTDVPASAGILQGGGALLSGCVIAFAKAIGILRNIKDGKTGADIDYRLQFLNEQRGCIAWDSIVAFHNLVGYMTPQGYVVTDGEREVLISEDVWDAGTGVGEWAYEIQQCLASVAKDDDSAHFHAQVLGDQLHVTYRSGGTVETIGTAVNFTSWRGSTAGIAQVFVGAFDMEGGRAFPAAGVQVSAQVVGGVTSTPESQICADGLGGCYVAFTDRRNGTTDDLYVQHVLGDGTLDPAWPVGGLGIRTGLTGHTSIVALVSDGGTGCHVAWEDARAGTPNEKPYAQRVAMDATVAWTPNGVQLSTFAGGNIITNMKILADPSTGGAIYVWVVADAGDIYGQRVSGAGVIQWVAAGVALDTSASDPGIVSDGSGGFYLCQDGGSDIELKRFDSAGVAVVGWSSPLVLDASASVGVPVIVASGSDSVIVLWVQFDTPNLSVWGQRVNSARAIQWAAGGVRLTAALHDQAVAGLTAVTDGTGGALFAWNKGDVAGASVRAQRVSNAGVAQWGADGVLVRSITDSIDHTSVASDLAGGLYIVWDQSTGTQVAAAQWVNSAGVAQWTADGVLLSNRSGVNNNPRIAENPSVSPPYLTPDRRMVFDFSAGVDANGLAMLINPVDGRPWPWSAPLRQNLSNLGQVRKSDGLHRYGTEERNTGATDGRVDEFDTGMLDNGALVTRIAYGPTDFCGSLRKKKIKNGKLIYRKPFAGLVLGVSRDKNRASETLMPLPSSGADSYTRRIQRMPQASRSPAEVVELSVADDGTGSQPPEIWGGEFDVEILEGRG